MTTTKYKQHDRLPIYTALLRSGTDPIDLTDCTVKFIMKRSVSQSTPTKVSAPAVVVDGPTGSVQYVWALNDLDTPGEFSVEWEITFPNTKKLTVPSSGYDSIVVVRDLG